mmetsp:Transcript_57975/g.99845  ORF Transcript_57975/g.99845 Transcript_57975/m.99845 type:complete len:180 (-) Transcript_57975:139-678(-)
MDSLSLDAGLLQQVLQQEQQIREVKGRKAVLKNLHEATKASLQDIEINVKETEDELETSEQEVLELENTCGHMVQQKNEWSDGVQAIETDTFQKESEIKVITAETVEMKKEFVAKMSDGLKKQRASLNITATPNVTLNQSVSDSRKELAGKLKHATEEQRLTIYESYLTIFVEQFENEL